MVLDIPSGTSPSSATVANTDTQTPENDPYAESHDPYADSLAETTPGTSPSVESTPMSIGDDSNRWSMKTPDGNVYGPVDFDELNQWLAEGRVSVQCQLQKEGERTWQNAAIVFPQLASAAMSTTTSNPYQARQQSYSRPSSGYSTSGRRYRSHNGVAILLFGIFGFIICPIFSIVAWVMGNNELAAIKRGEVDPEGKGMATAGMILGIINTVLNLLGFVMACLVFGLAAAAGP